MMKKQRIALINSIILLILGFFPLLSGGNGKSFSVISVLKYAAGGMFTSGAPTYVLVVWDIVIILSYIIYPVRIISLARGEENTRLRSAALYVGFIGSIASATILAALLLIGGADVKYPTVYLLLIMVISCATWGFERFGPSGSDEEKEAKKKKIKRRTVEDDVPVSGRVVFALLSAAFIANALFIKWVKIAGGSYTVPEFFRLIIRYGGLAGAIGHMSGMSVEATVKSAEFTALVPSCYVLYLIPAAVVISAFRIILIAFRKRHFAAGNAVTIMTIMQVLVVAIFGGYDVKVGFFIAAGIAGLDFLMAVYYRQKKDMADRADQAKLMAEARAEERRRKRYFPGKYGKDFYAVVRKNFRYNIRSYILFLIGAGGVATILCVLFGVCVGLGGNGFLLDIPDEINFGESMLATTKQILPVFAFFSILILALIITHYIRTRMVNYSVFSALGIRPDTLRRVIAIEYLGCLAASLLAGLLAGTAVFTLIRHRIMAAAPGIEWNHGTLATFGYTAAAFVFVALIATLINYHLFEYSDIMNLSPKNEDEPFIRRFAAVRVVAGLAVVLYSAVQFMRVVNGENFEWIIWILIGCFIALRGIMAGAVRLRTHSASDRKLLDTVPWRHAFKTNTRFWFLLFAFQLLMFAVYIPDFSANRVAESTDRLFPYDFVCMAHQGDEGYFKEIEEKYDAEVTTYPMFRVTTPLGQPYSWKQALNSAYVSVLWPQGQHIAIPESAYERLEKARGLHHSPLGLKGRQIHVVYQQDMSVKAHPLDWYMSGTNRFRIGQPLNYYNYIARERLYPSHNAKSTERSILTGMFGRGSQEDIIVMSDEYFDRLYAKQAAGKGPSSLELITCDAGNYDAVNAELKVFAKKNSSDSQWDASIQPYYGRKEMTGAAVSARTLTGATNMMVIIGLTLSAFFIFYIKYGLEERDLADKFDLLRRLGMPEREQKKLLRKEMGSFIFGTEAVSLIAAIPLVIMTTFMRMYTAPETGSFLRMCGMFILIYTAVYITGMCIVGHRYIHSVIGREIRREGE